MTEPGPTRAEERLIHALRTRRQREREGLFLAEGVRIAEEAVAAGTVLDLAVTSPSLEDTERGVALRARLEAVTTVRRVSDAAMRALAPTEAPQGVLLVARTPAVALDDVPLPDAAVVLVLDGVQDPGNFGTLVRTADAFAVAAVLALPGTVDPWNAKAVRAAAGASFRVPIAQHAPDEAAAWLRARGFTILAADAAGAPVEDVARGPRVALIVGNEGAGLRPDTLALADATVAVPIAGHAESLNVGIAAGVLLFQLTRTA